MGRDVERRAKRDERELFAFCFLDRAFYEDIGRYVPGSSTYLTSTAALLPGSWNLRKEGIWYVAARLGDPMPPCGFKIHISAVIDSARALLNAVVPILVEDGVSFKFLVDETILRFTLSKSNSRVVSGKFIAAYPASRELFIRTIERLYEVTKDFQGPYVLNDRPYKDSKVLFYRFGGFVPVLALDVFGEKRLLLRLDDGREIEDRRLPYFVLPEGIEDPFPRPATAAPRRDLLDRRYRVNKAISYSNAGGVYEAVDTRSGETVIIKEARPHIMVTMKRDAHQTLARERDILLKLSGTGVVPRALAFFGEWTHTFLVQEYKKGVLFAKFCRLEENALCENPRPTRKDLSRFVQRFRTLASNLIDAAEAIHAMGVVIGDISPNNILVDPDSLDVVLVDLEGAETLGERLIPGERLTTTGYTATRKHRSSKATPADDFYALSRVLFSLLLPLPSFFELNPKAESRFLRSILQHDSLPSEIRLVLRGLQRGNVRGVRFLLTRKWRLGPKLKKVRNPAIRVANLPTILRQISSSLLHNFRPNRPDAFWPADYRVFSTNPLNVAFGALGVALFLQRWNGKLPANVMHAILTSPLSTSMYPPGLFTGLAGIAWAFERIGLMDRGASVMDLANSSKLLDDSADMFYGLAGIGLANIYFWKVTGEQRFLDAAAQMGASILAKRKEVSTGTCWLNVDGNEYFGYAHGSSGIAYFLLCLSRVTHNPKFRECAVKAMEHEIASAHPSAMGPRWAMLRGSPLPLAFWRFGNAGIGSVALRFHDLLGDPYYKQLAIKVAEPIQIKFAAFPGQFVGLSGVGEFFLDLFRFTRDKNALQQSRQIARGILLFKVPHSTGVMFPGEELLRLSADFGTGSAGVGLFFARLLDQERREFMDLEDPVMNKPAGANGDQLPRFCSETRL